MKKYVCEVCGYVYDPAKGDPDNGIAPGTAFEDIPDTWSCPECGAELRCRTWVPQNKDRQIGLVKCPQGHEAFLRLRFSRRPSGRYSALRCVYPATQEAAAFYRKKYQKQQESIKRLRKLAEKAKKSPQGTNTEGEKKQN